MPERPRPSAEEISQWIANTRSLRSLIKSDPHRPSYHFVAPEGAAMPFDPNGAIYWKGKYHLGYIYQKRPDKATWSPVDISTRHVWGHIVSTDLLHWTLYPDMIDVKEGDKETGIFSGGAFLSREGVPHVIYYGLGVNSNLIAYATDDDLKVWEKFSKPALTPLDPTDSFKADAGKYSTFDPCAWYDRDADFYYQISGGRKPALFKSKDLHDWTYIGDLIDRSNPMRHPEEDLSCPAFFSLGTKWMLLFISHQQGAQYYTGTFSNDRFFPEQHGRMNWPGGSFCSAEQLRDARGRNLIWGWVVERKPEHLPNYGWSGIMSLPRVVTMGDDGKLRINPPEELRAIRLQETREEDIELPPNSERTLYAQGRSIELKVEISTARKSSAGVKVFASPDGSEETVIFYDPVAEELVVDFSKSSVKAPVSYSSHLFTFANISTINAYPKTVSQQRAPLHLRDGEPLKLDIFLDKSVIEVFANGIQCITQIVYPELETSTSVKVFSGQERSSIREIHSWSIAPTNAY